MFRILHHLAALMFAAMALLISAQLSAAAESDIELNALLLPGTGYMIGTASCTEPGILAGFWTASGVFDDSMLTRSYAVGAEEITLSANLSYPRRRAGYPQLLTSAGVVFTKRELANPAIPQITDRRRIMLLDPSRGSLTDISPVNLQAATRADGAMGPLLYSSNCGLTILKLDPGSGRAEVWQGCAQMETIQELANVVALGEGFTSCGYSSALLSADGSMYILDDDSGRFAVADWLSPLGRNLSRAIAERQPLQTQFVFSEEAAIFRNDDAPEGEYVVVSASGGTRVLPRTHADELDLASAAGLAAVKALVEGDAQAQAAAGVALLQGYRTDLAAVLPPETIDVMSLIVPIDAERIGILDKTYQRLIVISCTP